MLFACLLGLIFGSFANVLIHRLPIILARNAQELYSEQATLRAVLDGSAPEPPPVPSGEAQPGLGSKGPFSLAWPASHCPHCGHTLRWFHNIPLFSYLFLRGRCTFCGESIAWRYPVIELLAAVLMGLSYVRYGLSVQAFVWGGVWIACLALCWIDWEHYLLPDALTLPIMWAGLLFASIAPWLPPSLQLSPDAFPSPSLEHALWGAALGYGVLWLVHSGFRYFRGVEGMGQGDFKLLAALGAWLGVHAVWPLLFLASLLGVVAALLLSRLGWSQRATQYGLQMGAIAFGPYLIGAGFMIWLFPGMMTRVYAI